MNEPKTRSWDLLTPQYRERCVQELIRFFYAERGEEVGVIAAGDVLDAVLQLVTPAIYNAALQDVKTITARQHESTDLELDLLKKSV